MPEWAETAKDFWDAADTYERANGRVYTEIVVAIPRELSKADRRTLIEGFVGQEIGERFAYTVAIHNPRAMDGGEQPHAHIMFSIRELDGIERSREQFFRRANDKHPELGGARKSREWSKDSRENDRVNEIRLSWEKAANLALEKAGHEVRIDRRTLKEQGIDREPEPKMGPIVTQRLKRGLETELGDKVIELRNYRKQEKEISELEQELKHERAKVYDFVKEREARGQARGNGFSFFGEKREVPEEEKQKYRRTVDLVLTRYEREGGDIEYRWKKSGRVAFVDKGQEIVFDSITPVAVKAGLQVAKEKGWEGVQVTGSEEFRRESWLQGQIMAISVQGYEPRELDLQKLEELRKEQFLAKEKARSLEPGREELWMKAADVIEALKEQETGIEREMKAIWAERKALGLQRGSDWTERYPEPLTEGKALEQSRFEHQGGRLKKLHDLARAQDEAFRGAEESLAKFRREQKELGIKRYLPRYVKEEKGLSRALDTARETYNESANQYNKLLKEYKEPGHKEAIERRASELLRADELAQERIKDVERRYSDGQRRHEDISLDKLRLKELGDLEVKVRRGPGGGTDIADREELRQQAYKLALERQKKRGKGLGLER